MNIKSSKVLVDEANKQIKTLNAIEVKKMLEKGEATLIDIRDIRELWREGTLKEEKKECNRDQALAVPKTTKNCN